MIPTSHLQAELGGNASNFLHPLSLFYLAVIKQFSVECRKTKTKAITSANHKRPKQCNEPITNNMRAGTKRGKNARASCDWHWPVLLLIG